MTSAAEHERSEPAFSGSDPVPIADLSPQHRDPNAHIRASVVLVWPYSSSTGKLSLLLADPDIRLCKSKGQVKVTFHGGCAREVAQSHVGIGDAVRLALAGAEWTETGNVVSTPGKKIDWDIEYKERLLLEVQQGRKPPTIIDYTSERSSPILNYGCEEVQPQANGPLDSAVVVEVPFLPDVLHQPRRASGGVVTSLADPFAGDDGYIIGKGRKRTKFGRRSGAWSLVDDQEVAEPTPSAPGGRGEEQVQDEGVSSKMFSTADLVVDEPAHGTAENGEIPGADRAMPPSPDIEDRRSAHPRLPSGKDDLAQTEGVELESRPALMGPPQTPIKPRPRGRPESLAFGNENLGDIPPSPRLLPLPSPGLPMVSPLVQRSGLEVGYFPPAQAPTSELDALGQQEITEEAKRSPISVGDDASTMSEDSLVLIEQRTVQEIDRRNDEEEDINSHHQGPAGTVLPSEPVGNAFTTEGQTHHHLEFYPARAEPEENVPVPDQFALQTSNHQIDFPDHMPQEIEDDDLYGGHNMQGRAPPPTQTAMKTSASDATRATTGQVTNPLDTLEQFLHMSPVTANLSIDPGGMYMSVDQTQSSIAPTVGTDAIEPWHDSVSVTAVEHPSTGTFSAPHVPFQRRRHGRLSQGSSTKSSAHGSLSQFLDGSVDEDDRNRKEEWQAATLQMRSSSRSDSGLPTHVEDISDGRSPEFQQLSSQDIPGQVAADRGPVVLNGVLEALTARMESETDWTILSSTPGEGNILVANVATKQLPTPEHTQQEPGLAGEDDHSHTTAVEKEPHLPSPRHTQEMDGRPEPVEPVKTPYEDSPKHDQERPPSPRMEATLLSRRRTSQRQPRKSITSGNLSSPYFAPRRRNRGLPPTSPTREEMIGPSQAGIASSPTTASSPPTSGSRLIDQSSPVSLVEDRSVLATKEVSTDTTKDVDLGTPPRRRGITTALAYYPHLASLSDYFGHLVDVIALCTAESTTPTRAKAGPKDYHTTLHLADSSFGPQDHTTTTVQIFRPYRVALPHTRRGDVVMLRNVKVQTVKGKCMLLSTSTSSWAVFKTDVNAIPIWSEVVVSGPPIEFDAAENARVEALVRWWEGGGKDQYPDLYRDHGGRREQDDTDSARRPEILDDIQKALRSEKVGAPERRLLDRTDPFANEQDDVSLDEEEEELAGERSMPLMSPTTGRTQSDTMSIDSGAEVPRRESAPGRRCSGRRSASVVHELRDGTKYVDDDRRHSGSVIHELRDGVSWIDE